MNLAIKEKDFQQQIIDMAKLLGWWVYHPYDSRRSTAGWPDLTLIHFTTGRTIFAEVKAMKGRLSKAQKVCQELLRMQNDVRVWRPCDWPEIEDVLRSGQ